MNRAAVPAEVLRLSTARALVLYCMLISEYNIFPVTIMATKAHSTMTRLSTLWTCRQDRPRAARSRLAAPQRHVGSSSYKESRLKRSDTPPEYSACYEDKSRLVKASVSTTNTPASKTAGNSITWVLATTDRPTDVRVRMSSSSSRKASPVT